jgi:hypothetical protein
VWSVLFISLCCGLLCCGGENQCGGNYRKRSRLIECAGVERKERVRTENKNAIARRIEQSGNGLNMARNAVEGIKTK